MTTMPIRLRHYTNGGAVGRMSVGGIVGDSHVSVMDFVGRHRRRVETGVTVMSMDAIRR